MTLIDRLDPDKSTKSIAFHDLSSAMFFFINGTFDRTKFKTVLDLDSTDDAQIDQVVAYYNSLPKVEKDRFRDTVESAGNLWESKLITEAEFKSLIGMV